jgi:hypothetical protein
VNDEPELVAYSVTPYGQDVAHTSGRSPSFVRVVGEGGTTTMRAADAPPPIPSRRRPTPAPSSATGGAELVRIKSAVMRAALLIADGDPRRLVLNADGSVTVLNGVRR